MPNLEMKRARVQFDSPGDLSSGSFRAARFCGQCLRCSRRTWSLGSGLKGLTNVELFLMLSGGQAMSLLILGQFSKLGSINQFIVEG